MPQVPVVATAWLVSSIRAYLSNRTLDSILNDMPSGVLIVSDADQIFVASVPRISLFVKSVVNVELNAIVERLSRLALLVCHLNGRCVSLIPLIKTVAAPIAVSLKDSPADFLPSRVLELFTVSFLFHNAIAPPRRQKNHSREK
jgi:hypothetical protein